MFRQHHPPHWYKDNSIYFITARTIDAESYFIGPSKRKIIYDALKEGIKKFKVDLYAFVILNNHYHLLFKIQKGVELTNFIGFINGKSSKTLNELENKSGRKIWYQYWDHCIRNEKDFFLHFNYEHHNPVKHGYVNLQEEALDYQFCSYKYWVDKEGIDWLSECFARYPIKDFTIEHDGF